jgi:putative multiple sugar transport system permease protein
MSSETLSPGAFSEKRSYRSFLKTNMREYGMLLSLILIMIFFQIATDGRLFQPDNLTNIIQQRGYIVVMALGMLLVIVSGHIDLSVGWLSGFLGAVSAILMVTYHIHWLPAVVLTLMLGAVVGACQGAAVAYLRIPAFIVTLAGMLIFRGLTINVLGGQNIGPFPDQISTLLTGFFPEPIGRIVDPFAPYLENLRVVMAPTLASIATAYNHMADAVSFLPDMTVADPTLQDVSGSKLSITSLILGAAVIGFMLTSAITGRLKQMRQGMSDEPTLIFVIKNLAIAVMLLALCYLFATYKGLPNVLVIMGVLIALYSFGATRMTIGRRIYALGGNEKAARLSGINTERLVFLTFMNMGILSALAGMMFATRLGWATPKSGDGFELDVIAACFIGGASASGGVGTVMGAVIGAFIMGVMNNGMSMMGIGIDFQFIIKGAVLFLAVFVDVYNKSKA